jgi:hypothetical protein
MQILTNHDIPILGRILNHVIHIWGMRLSHTMHILTNRVMHPINLVRNLGHTVITRLQRFQLSITNDPMYELQLQ